MKVTNTIFYPYQRKPVPITKRKKRKPVQPVASPAPSTELYTLPTKPALTNSRSGDSSKVASKKKKQTNSSKFQMNCRLEVMDFNDEWLVLGTFYH